MNITFNTKSNAFYKKQNATSFNGVTEDFGKALLNVSSHKTLSSQEKVALCNQFKLAISDIMKSAKLINQGFFNNVYKIDDNFVAKIKKKFIDKPWLVGNEYKQGVGQFKNLKTYYGEEILDIGGIKILKNIGEHLPAGIPEYKLNKMDFLDILHHYSYEYLPKFSNAPQESFNDLAQDFKTLNNIEISRSNYHYDFDGRNPNNIALTKDNKLVMVDDLDVRATSNTNDTSKLLRMLLLSLTRNESIYCYDDIGYISAVQLFKKIILATERAELPNHDKAHDLNYWKRVFRNLSVRCVPETFVNKLDELRIKESNIEMRLCKVKKMLDELFDK